MDKRLIHPTADVSPDARTGRGTRIWNNVQIRGGATLGTDCIVGKDAYIDHDVSIGNRVKIQNGALLYAPLLIEDGVFIGPQVVFTNDRLPRAVTPEGELKAAADWVQSQTRVMEGASIGAHATILPGITVGAWALVGAAAVVTSDIPAYALALGAPARVVGWACRCGARLPERASAECGTCGRRYAISDGGCREAGDGKEVGSRRLG